MLTLHSTVIATYQQILPQVARFISKAEEYCAEHGVSPDELAQSRLAPDMWPLTKQISQCAHHSARAIEAVRVGAFSPDPAPTTSTFADLRAEIDEALALVNAVSLTELDSIAERDMEFRAGPYSMNFNVANFLLSFSLPNFYFHTTTAYNILRSNGVQLGKRDFIGNMRNNPGNI